jgi:PAS domain-containing protein
MYKLICVAGIHRGEEFPLKDGDNIVGRSQESDIKVNCDGVSKKHLKLIVNNDIVYVQDLNSSNGTFLNNNIVQRSEVQKGDLISLPDTTFKLIEIKEKIVEKEKSFETAEDFNDYELSLIGNQNFISKGIFWFRKRVMPIVYGFNESYEWAVLLGILTFFFVAINILLTIGPVLQDTNKLLLKEVKLRGAQYAEEVARLNSIALSRMDLEKINTRFLDNTKDISSYQLFDMEGRVVKPTSQLNSYINDTFSISVKNWISQKEENMHDTFHQYFGDGVIGVGKAIKVYSLEQQREVPVGIIAIKFTPSSLVIEAANNKKAYLEALIISSIVAIIFFGMVYFVTTRHINEMRYQIELAQQGKIKELNSKHLMKESKSLRESINSILRQLREFSSDDDQSFEDIEEDYEYVSKHIEFVKAISNGCIVLDSQQNIKEINGPAEDLLGSRASHSIDTSLLDTLWDQGLAAVILDLCDQSSNQNGDHFASNYEIGGINYSVNVTSLIGKDNYPKSYMVTFIKDE